MTKETTVDPGRTGKNPGAGLFPPGSEVCPTCKRVHKPKVKNPAMSRRGRVQSGPDQIAMAKRISDGLKMRMAGATFEVIADALGWNNPQAAHDAITRALMNSVNEPAT